VISFDTNVLIYATDVKAGARHTTARDVVELAKNKNTVLTEQSLVEFVNVAVRKAQIPFADAVLYVRRFLLNFRLILPQPRTIEDVFELMSRHNLSVWDARLLAVCDAYGCDHLLSEDLQDGAQYSGVTVVNLFNPANADLIRQLMS
jgi:predicted nucleic acid-binding protein